MHFSLHYAPAILAWNTEHFSQKKILFNFYWSCFSCAHHPMHFCMLFIYHVVLFHWSHAIFKIPSDWHQSASLFMHYGSTQGNLNVSLYPQDLFCSIHRFFDNYHGGTGADLLKARGTCVYDPLHLRRHCSSGLVRGGCVCCQLAHGACIEHMIHMNTHTYPGQGHECSEPSFLLLCQAVAFQLCPPPLQIPPFSIWITSCSQYQYRCMDTN